MNDCRITNALQGDLVSWEAEQWIINSTNSAVQRETIQLSYEICSKNYSLHYIPIKTIFEKAVKICDKFSGRVIE